MRTHVHFDHFGPATLAAVIPVRCQPTIVAPQTVAEKIPDPIAATAPVNVLEDPDGDVRWLAAEGLIVLGPEGVPLAAYTAL